MKKGSIIAVILVLIVGAIIALKFINGTTDSDIPDGYIAVFNGGVGERLYATYVYKIENDKPNMGFKYINVESTSTSCGSGEYNNVIKKTGIVDFTDDVFTVADEFGAYSYVYDPNNNETYSIEEFQDRFIMN